MLLLFSVTWLVFLKDLGNELSYKIAQIFCDLLAILKIVTPEEKQLRLPLEQLGNFRNN